MVKLLSVRGIHLPDTHSIADSVPDFNRIFDFFVNRASQPGVEEHKRNTLLQFPAPSVIMRTGSILHPKNQEE